MLKDREQTFDIGLLFLLPLLFVKLLQLMCDDFASKLMPFIIPTTIIGIALIVVAMLVDFKEDDDEKAHR